jgi:hypothetical protein
LRGLLKPIGFPCNSLDASAIPTGAFLLQFKDEAALHWFPIAEIKIFGASRQKFLFLQ